MPTTTRRTALTTVAAAAVALPVVQAEARPDRVVVTLPERGKPDGLDWFYVAVASDLMRGTPGLSFETALELAWTA